MSDDINLPVHERIARAIEVKSGGLWARVVSAPDSRTETTQGIVAGLEMAARIAREISPWVAVGDRLPGQAGDYAVIIDLAGATFRDVTRYIPGTGWMEIYACADSEQRVTHWATLPEPPPTGCDR